MDRYLEVVYCSFEQVYRATIEPIIPIIFQRTKATCFAYGQTGMQWHSFDSKILDDNSFFMLSLP